MYTIMTPLWRAPFSSQSPTTSAFNLSPIHIVHPCTRLADCIAILQTAKQQHAQRSILVPAASTVDDGTTTTTPAQPSTSAWETRGEPASRTEIQALVETAMLSAVTGLAYLLASIIKVEGYLGYLLPFPVIISAMRSGPAAARKTMTATCFLLLVLLGPVRALSYLLAHGLYALSLGVMWSVRAPWVVSVPLGMMVRVAGALAYLCVASWALNENMLALLVANVTSLVDQIAALFGMAGSPSLMAVLVTMVCVMLVNSAFYVTLMHMLYEIILRQLGYATGKMPGFVERWMYRQRVVDGI